MNWRNLMRFRKIRQAVPEPEYRDTLNETLWCTRFNWYDVVSVMHPTIASKFNGLPDAIKAKLMYDYGHVIAKCLEAGIMSEWTVVMDSAIDCSGILDAIKSEHYIQEIFTGRKRASISTDGSVKDGVTMVRMVCKNEMIDNIKYGKDESGA